jgi:hypothetical protein
MAQHHSDFPAALTGLLVGAVALLAVVFGMVTIVNVTQEGKSAESGHVAPH